MTMIDQPGYRVIALAGLLTSACSSAPAGSLVERADSAGIEIVRNLGGDRPLAWSFEPVLTLGGADDGPEAFYRLVPSLIDVDRRGNIHVLDAAGHRVVVFGPDGSHLRTLGREGGGPGELEYPASIDVAVDGTVRVRDHARTALTAWDSAGELLPVHRVEVRMLADFVTQDDAIVASLAAPAPNESVLRERLVVMRPGDTTEVAALERPRPAMLDFGCVGIMLPPRFAPELVWAADDQRVAAAVESAYDLRVVEDGSERRFRREVPARAVTREMALQDIGEGMKVSFMGGRGCDIAPDLLIERQGYAPTLPAIGAVALAPDGTVWVARRVIKGEPAVTDIFDATGEYLGTLASGSPFPAAFTPTGDVVAIERDELDVDRLVVYRVHGAT